MTRSPRARPSDTSSGSYCPDAGDLVWLDFDTQKGREQAGRRPALVLSPIVYNKRRTVCVVCPVTSQVKGYPFEVALPADGPIRGVILSDQIKTLSWLERRASQAGTAPPAVVEAVKARLRALLDL